MSSTGNSSPEQLFFFTLSPDDVEIEVPTSPSDDIPPLRSLARPKEDFRSPTRGIMDNVDCPMISHPATPVDVKAPILENVTLIGPSPSLQPFTMQTPVKTNTASAVSDTPPFPEKGSTPRRRYMNACNQHYRPRGRSERDELLKSCEKKRPAPGNTLVPGGTAPKAPQRRALFQGSRPHNPPSTSKKQPSSSRNDDSEEDIEPKTKTPRKTI